MVRFFITRNAYEANVIAAVFSSSILRKEKVPQIPRSSFESTNGIAATSFSGINRFWDTGISTCELTN